MLDTIRSRLATYSPKALQTSYARAGILVPITDSAEPALILTQRSTRVKTHPGQVAFPGGREEKLDQTLMHTALRETEEEIGLPSSQVEVVAQLSDVISRYRIAVTPFVAVVSDTHPLVPDQGEIESVFKVPLHFFLEEAPERMDQLDFEEFRLSVPSWRFEEYRIWGLSAVVLMDFLKAAFDVEIGRIERL